MENKPKKNMVDFADHEISSRKTEYDVNTYMTFEIHAVLN